MVYFVGAGPGDPDLITVKGKRKVDEADVIIYAGSLVNPQVMADRKKECQVFNSAYMTLEEVLDVMKKRKKKGRRRCGCIPGIPACTEPFRNRWMRWMRLAFLMKYVPESVHFAEPQLPFSWNTHCRPYPRVLLSQGWRDVPLCRRGKVSALLHSIRQPWYCS